MIEHLAGFKLYLGLFRVIPVKTPELFVKLTDLRHPSLMNSPVKYPSCKSEEGREKRK